MDRAGARIEFSPEVVTMNALLLSCTTALRRIGGAAACTTRKTKTVTTAKTAD
jgi:hypothetical protein